jgi:hypothetical protein
MMVMGYNNFQDVALGLSFALAIDQLNPSIPRKRLPMHLLHFLTENWAMNLFGKIFPSCQR